MDEAPLPPPPPQPPVAPVAVPASSMPQITPEQAAALLGRTMICPNCHFPTKPEYYFCPNCGTKLTEPPIGTGLVDQLLLYSFSIILPWILYLAITKWQGIKYLRAPDRNAKQIGLIALILLVVSSIIAFWLYDVWFQNFLNGFSQSQTTQLNSLGL